MKKTLFASKYFLIFLLWLWAGGAAAQSNATKSILINIGSSTTSSPATDPVYLSTFSNVKLGSVFPNATVLSDNQVFSGVISNKAVAYNPSVDTIYTIENLTTAACKFYPYGFGEPYSWAFPGVAPAASFSFTGMYNTEFDNRFVNRMWYISALTTSGFTLNSILSAGWPASSMTAVAVSFPAGALPSGAVGTNDLVIAPNNRMFFVVGDNGDLYEIVDYTSASPSVTRLGTVGAGVSISSMAYLDGDLLLASYGGGSDAYRYSIASGTMAGPFAFPGNSRRYAEPAPAVSQTYATVDATSTTLAVGTAHRLKQANNCATYATLTYEVMLKNIGKMDMATPQIVEDLGAAFPGGTISLVTATVISNPAGLVLNTGYNGTTSTNLIDNTVDKPLNSGTKGGDSILLEVSFTVSGLTPGALYTINAIGSGKAYFTSGGAMTTLLSVTDVSNNGPASVTTAYDPNNNGVADDPAESTPTSYIFDPPAMGDPCVLPLELLSFNAQLQGTAVELRWYTASERNSAYFAVERSSDGQQWTEQHKVPAAGNSSAGQHYEFRDAAALPGMSYYRLKMTDVDGSYSYSMIRKINTGAAGLTASLLVSPNPATGRVLITNMGSPEVTVTNIMGQVVTVLVIATGNNQAVADFSGLLPGIYLLRCHDTTIRVVHQ